MKYTGPATIKGMTVPAFDVTIIDDPPPRDDNPITSFTFDRMRGFQLAVQSTLTRYTLVERERAYDRVGYRRESRPAWQEGYDCGECGRYGVQGVPHSRGNGTGMCR